MSLKSELEQLCQHPEGYLYLQDNSGSYLTPSQMLASLPQEILSASFGSKACSGQPKEYWIYKSKFLFGTEEMPIFKTYIPEGREGWASDFMGNPDLKIHYYREKDADKWMVSLCKRDRRPDDYTALFLLNPPVDQLCKFCLKELKSHPSS